MSGVIWQSLPNTPSFVPEHDQPLNVQSLDVSVGWSTIVESVVKGNEHVFGPTQAIPAGLLVTVPWPTTWTVTVVVKSDRPLALPTPSASISTSPAASQTTLLPIGAELMTFSEERLRSSSGQEREPAEPSRAAVCIRHRQVE
jgi:hypothetical protein